MAAMAATAIPAMAYFHTFPLYFLPANILASIAIVPMMFCGVLLAIATMTGIGHGALAYACDRLYAFIELSAAQHHAYQHVMLYMHIHCAFVII